MTSPAEVGDPTLPLLVLGEAPAAVEMRRGEPLVGPSGDVFNECLAAAGLRRTDCYILNIWPYQVSKDNNGNFFSRQHGQMIWGNRSGFTQQGLDDAQPTIDRIKKSGSNLIVPLGQQATALATDKRFAIAKWRGSVLEGTAHVDHRKVIPTLHPAFTLHGTFLQRYNIIADLKRAKEDRWSKELNLPSREIVIRPTMRQIEDVFAQCRAARRISTDLEVINHQVSCFSVCCDSRYIVVVPLTDEGYGHYWSATDEARIWELYADIMGDPAVDKINQNLIGFDVPFLFTQNSIRTRGRLLDTMIAQRIIYPEFPSGLDYIASIHTREPYYKDEGKMWKNQGGDWPTFWRYCGKDAAVALEAWEVLAAELQDGYQPTYDRTVRLAEPLLYMASYGMRVDKEHLAQAHAGVSAQLEDKKRKLRETAEWDFNPNSPVQCQKYFYGTKKITPYTGGTGKPTTDDKAMARIYRRYNLPEAKLVQDIRQLQKLKSTYMEVALDKDGRLRCSWNSRGTWTGRLSSSSTIFGTGMNLQNLHPEFKGFITADDDPLHTMPSPPLPTQTADEDPT